MPDKKSVVERYIDGFVRSDHARILSCLNEDVVWAIHGHKTLEGKEAFDAEIEGQEGHEGNPTMTIDRLIEDGDAVAAQGHGSIPREDGDPRPFVFCEVFAFKGDAVSRIDTYHVWLD
jgi:ketosteroid isomerase-like protein